MTASPAAWRAAWSEPVRGVVGSPRERPQAGALPTDVARFRELVWRPLAAADPDGRRWLAALGAFELLRHGAAEPGGILHATGRSIAGMLAVSESTWCRSDGRGRVGYGPLLETAGLLARDGWERWRLPLWEALQNRARDGSLQGRFIYTHRPTFRATVVGWRLAGVSLAAIGAWSLLRYCHTRWDTAALPLPGAAIARELGVKPQTWSAWAAQLAGCGGLERLPGGPGWRLPLYFALRTGRGLLEAQPSGAGEPADHAAAAGRVHASSADRHARPADGLTMVRARVDPARDGAFQEEPAAGDPVEETVDLLASAVGDMLQRAQVRASPALRADVSALLKATGWQPRRLAAELCRRELRTAREPVRVLVWRARSLLDTHPSARPRRQPPAAGDAPERPRRFDVDQPGADAHGDPPSAGSQLDALDPQTRSRILEAARARLSRSGIPGPGPDLPDHHPLLRGEALNILRREATRIADATDAPAASSAPSVLASRHPRESGDRARARGRMPAGHDPRPVQTPQARRSTTAPEPPQRQRPRHQLDNPHKQANHAAARDVLARDAIPPPVIEAW